MTIQKIPGSNIRGFLIICARYWVRTSEGKNFPSARGTNKSFPRRGHQPEEVTGSPPPGTQKNPRTYHPRIPYLCAILGSNQRPLRCERSALPLRQSRSQVNTLPPPRVFVKFVGRVLGLVSFPSGGLSIYLSAGAAGGECRVCISIVVACGYAAAIENPRFFGTEDSLFLA